MRFQNGFLNFRYAPLYSKTIIFGLKIGSMNASQPPLPHLPSLSELGSRLQVMSVSALEDNLVNETSSQSAESRPLILSLRQDLYDGYITLSDHFSHSKPQNCKLTSHENDSDSMLSFQDMQVPVSCYKRDNIDELVSQFVTVNLEKDIAKDELQCKEQKLQEASKTIELLKKLVILLDMEKEVAVEDTANLRYKLTSLLEENKELATEAWFMKKEAVRLTRCMLKMRDEHFHKISHLQNQIYALQLSRESVYENVSSPSCFGLKSKKRKTSETRSEPGEKKRSKWLKRLNTINPFTKCNISPSPSSF